MLACQSLRNPAAFPESMAHMAPVYFSFGPVPAQGRTVAPTPWGRARGAVNRRTANTYLLAKILVGEN